MEQPKQRLEQPVVQQLLWGAAKALGQASAKTYLGLAQRLEAAFSSGQWSRAMELLLNQDGSIPAKAAPKGLSPEECDTLRDARALCREVWLAQQHHMAWETHHRLLPLARALLKVWADLKRERGWLDMGDLEVVAHRMLGEPDMGAWLQEVLDWRVRQLLIDEFQDTNPLQWQVLYSWLQSYGGQSAAGPRVFIVGDPKQSIYRFRRADPTVFVAARQFVQQALQGDVLACDHTRRSAGQVVSMVNAVMLNAQSEGLMSMYRAHTTEALHTGEVLLLPLLEAQATALAKKNAPQRAIAADETGDLAAHPDGAPQNGSPEPEASAGAAWRDSLTQARRTAQEHVRQLEARQVARWIAQALGAGASPKEFLVIARKNERLARVEEELRQLGVPCARADQDSLYEAPEIQDMAALLQALLNPQDALSLAHALRCPVFGLADADLIRLAGSGAANWWEGVRACDLRDTRGQPIAPVLAAWRDMLLRWPVHDALSWMLEQGQILECYASSVRPAQLGRIRLNLQALVEASLGVQGGRFLTATAFLRQLRQGQVKAAAGSLSGAVRLLTVHKAKGLEAETVILLDADALPARKASMAALMDWPAQQAHPLSWVFVARMSCLPQALASLNEQEVQLSSQEEMNALYVALTRAKTRLLISASRGKRAPEQSWYQRIQACQGWRETGVHEGGQGQSVLTLGPDGEGAVQGELAGPAPFQASSDPPVELERLPMRRGGGDEVLAGGYRIDRSERPKQEPADEATRMGLAVHRLLQWAALHHGEPVSGWSDVQLARVAAEFGLDAAQQTQARAWAQTMYVRNPWLWDVRHLAWSGNEIELWSGQQRLRLDRAVRLRPQSMHLAGSGRCEWWVVDYKTSLNPPANAQWRAQVQAYAQAMALAIGCAPDAVGAALVGADGAFHELEIATDPSGKGFAG